MSLLAETLRRVRCYYLQRISQKGKKGGRNPNRRGKKQHSAQHSTPPNYNMAMDSGSDDEAEQLVYKVIIMGDGAVGKTSIINRFCQDGFAQSYKQTIGLDFFCKKLILPGGVNVTLQLWDIGGQQIGGKMLGKYIHGSHAIFFVYDTTNAESFKNIEDWHQSVEDVFKAEPKKPLMALVGNKIDLVNRQVKTDRNAAFAAERGMTPYMVSAKSGEKIHSLFQRIAAELAGVALTKSQLEVADAKVTAAIVQHPTAPLPEGYRGPGLPPAQPPAPQPAPKSDGCAMM